MIPHARGVVKAEPGNGAQAGDLSSALVVDHMISSGWSMKLALRAAARPCWGFSAVAS